MDTFKDQQHSLLQQLLPGHIDPIVYIGSLVIANLLPPSLHIFLRRTVLRQSGHLYLAAPLLKNLAVIALQTWEHNLVLDTQGNSTCTIELIELLPLSVYFAIVYLWTGRSSNAHVTRPTEYVAAPHRQNGFFVTNEPLGLRFEKQVFLIMMERET